ADNHHKCSVFKGTVEALTGAGMIRGSAMTFLVLMGASLRAQAPEASFGLTLGSVPEALYAQMPLPKDQGVLVEAVEPHSPAWRGGLRRFDIIMSLDAAAPRQDAKAITEQLKRVKVAKLTIVR